MATLLEAVATLLEVVAPIVEAGLILWAWLSVIFHTMRIIRRFSVVSAVEKVDNDIIGDLEQVGGTP